MSLQEDACVLRESTLSLLLGNNGSSRPSSTVPLIPYVYLSAQYPRDLTYGKQDPIYIVVAMVKFNDHVNRFNIIHSAPSKEECKIWCDMRNFKILYGAPDVIEMKRKVAPDL